MFNISKFTLSDKIYPTEYPDIRNERILWPIQILSVEKFGQYEKEKNRAP